MKQGGPKHGLAESFISANALKDWHSAKRRIRQNWKWIGLVAAVISIVVLIGYRIHTRRGVEAGRDIQKLLERYQIAIRARNPQWVADCYAPKVKTFYLVHNAPNSKVLSEFARSFDIYTDIDKFTISEVHFSELDRDRATATFDREWDFRGTKNYAGKEKEQMMFEKINGSWLIVSERELKLYWTQPAKVLRNEAP